ncbi:hypothetical protein [Nonomuraea sp. 10N515B]|uniref:hypothetical protein n=1 Tax=Nonomuraea sp. 10N515B TaxID=3457422 RepID=UPI003FCDF415
MAFHKEIAAHLADERMTEWKTAATYGELVEMERNGERDLREVVGEDSRTYSVVASVLPDGDGSVRMMVAVDDGGWSAFKPLIRGEIMRPDGTFLE